jgi:glucose/arabinose dehydrogenase
LLVLVPGVGGTSCKLFLDCGLRDSELSDPGHWQDLKVESGLVIETVASGFTGPSAFAFLPDGRILVAQVNGLVRVVRNGKVLGRPFLDLRGRTNTENLRGLVGLEPDPAFAQNGHVYVMYAYEDGSEPAGGEKPVRVSRVTARGDRASLASEVVILGRAGRGSCASLPVERDCIPADGTHMGGALDFAPDGTLFVGTGDGELGKKYEPGAHQAQNLDALTGKILRVTRSGKGLPTNPYWTGDADDNRSKVWAYGLRNPFRVSARPGSALPYVGDVGWNDREEIDVANRGVNLGWPCYEGRDRTARYRDTAPCGSLYEDATDRPVQGPLVEVFHDDGTSITGGDFRGRDEYVYGDYGRWWLRTLRLDADDRVVSGTDTRLARGASTPVQIRIGPQGDVYYLSIREGAVYRIRPVRR